MTKWASAFGKQLVFEEKFGAAWERLQSESSDAVEELRKEFTDPKARQSLSSSSGEQSIDIRDHRKRSVSYRMDKAEKQIRVTFSWLAKTEFAFRIMGSTGTLTSPAPAFGSIKPNSEISPDDLAEAGIRRLLSK